LALLEIGMFLMALHLARISFQNSSANNEAQIPRLLKAKVRLLEVDGQTCFLHALRDFLPSAPQNLEKLSTSHPNIGTPSL